MTTGHHNPSMPATEMRDRAAAPVDWADRFRAAAAAVDEEIHGYDEGGWILRQIAPWLESQHPDVVEAVGRALLGGQP